MSHSDIRNVAWKVVEEMLGKTITVPATGTASSTTYLRGDNTWSTPDGGGGGDMFKSDNLSGLANPATARTNMELGTAATTAATDYATAAQGSTANSALQPAGNGGSLTGLTKTQVGLANADNTSDASKPVSSATQAALDGKQVAGSYATGTGSANGTNTGDQTSIAGIAGTFAQFNTAVTDNDLVATNDARLYDARTPLAHAHAAADVTGTAVLTADARLSDARTPTAHSIIGAEHNGFPGGTSTFLRADKTFAAVTASASISQTEIDFGATGVSEAIFVIADANVSAASNLLGVVAYVAPTGKDLDELEMDQLDLKFAPGSGQFTLYAAASNDCLVAGAFKINYQVGA